jgi:hypothetical protein
MQQSAGNTCTILQPSMRRLKKILLRSSLVILLFAGMIILFISPLTRYLVQKYDVRYTGREITMDWAYVNPFTGYVHFDNFRIYEAANDTLFFSANGVSADFAMLKLFSKTYELTEITLDHPKGIIIQDKKILNITDIIERFSSDSGAPQQKQPVHFNILDWKIIAGEFHFHEKNIPVSYFIRNVEITSPGIRWDSDSIAFAFSFLPGIGSGDMQGNCSIGYKSMRYRFEAVAHTLDLGIIQEYLKELTNNGKFSANLDADIKAAGSFTDGEDIVASGRLILNDFHFGKTTGDDIASFRRLEFAIAELSPKKPVYNFDSVSLDHPFLKYDRYDYLDNIQYMFGNNGSKLEAAENNGSYNLVIEIAQYVRLLAKNVFRSDYRIDRMAIYNADVQYNDYTLNEKFSIALNPLTVTADSVDKNQPRLHLVLHTGLKPYGRADIRLGINPLDSSDFDLHYHLQQLPAALFNPYLISYTTFPFDRGTIEVQGIWKVQNGMIGSSNHVLIIDPRVADRVKNKGNSWIPLRVVMAFIRERGNVIDYSIPITGNMNDPKFHWHDVITDVLRNIFIKPLTTPYAFEVRNVETEIEKSLTMLWNISSDEIGKKQLYFLEKMATFLAENPAARIYVSPMHFTTREREYLLLYEARKKYYLAANGKTAAAFDKKDSAAVLKMAIKDSLFVHYLNVQTHDSTLYTVQDKCARMIGTALIDKRYRELNSARIHAFMQPFRDLQVDKQLTVTGAREVFPYNGFSFYRVTYSGEFPDYLLKAYNAMQELNNASPRKQFSADRNKNRR